MRVFSHLYLRDPAQTGPQHPVQWCREDLGTLHLAWQVSAWECSSSPALKSPWICLRAHSHASTCQAPRAAQPSHPGEVPVHTECSSPTAVCTELLILLHLYVQSLTRAVTSSGQGPRYAVPCTESPADNQARENKGLISTDAPIAGKFPPDLSRGSQDKMSGFILAIINSHIWLFQPLFINQAPGSLVLLIPE